ncbi:hypothetical protein GGR56DRAFT_688613 [Xylariaceae sp. FL0804]|nr:hypothetical protein GGR56DRAFT_688613 [Xylariaceae sp. FL0804]
MTTESLRHHHRHHPDDDDRDRHSSRHARPRSRSPTPPNPYAPPPLDAEAAFRESLFDALADDEGAAYWEGVYGQPIHVYGRPPTDHTHGSGEGEGEGEGDGGGGELEQMDDEQYAAHVRQKMWEKTHAGLLEERARRDERRRQRERERGEAAAETRRLAREMDASLRRGEERRRRRGARERWRAYLDAWARWDRGGGTAEGEGEGKGDNKGGHQLLCWPVASGRAADAARDAAAVRDFFVAGIDPAAVGEAGFLAALKEERVRWHPDKIQQRLGGRVDAQVMRDVTAVFQIVDRLWSDTRSKAKAK